MLVANLKPNLFLIVFLELFQFGESFVSNTWPLEPQMGEDNKRKENVEPQASNITTTQNEVSASGDGENTFTSEEEEDASSSVTITSPRVTDHPPILKVESNKPPIGKTKIRKNVKS